MKNHKGFVDCPSCKVWADIPSGFNETKHFAKCPQCGKPMYLNIGYDPIKDLAFQPSKKVIAGLMPNGL